MSLEKLTNQDLEERISSISERTRELKLILNDLKCPQAKKVLEIQISNYEDSMSLYEMELFKRNN